MSVEVQNQGGNYFVNNKPENVPAGNIGGAGTHVKYDTKEQAEQVAQELKDVDKNAIAQGTLQPDQGKKFSFTV